MFSIGMDDYILLSTNSDVLNHLRIYNKLAEIECKKLKGQAIETYTF